MEENQHEINEQLPENQNSQGAPMDEITGDAQPNPIAANNTMHPDVSMVTSFAEKVRSEIGKVVIGQEEMVELLLAGVLVGGHVLLEGYPGIAKTLTAKMLAKSIAADFSRIQFTPDLMPTDLTGTAVFNLKESEFSFRKGPVFSNIVLIDEINRAPAKTQAALMEVMEERQLTYDGETYKMGFPFFVIATQNPVEQEGTYNLPEAQLDRFIFRIRIQYPTLSEEQAILRRFQNDFEGVTTQDISSVVSIDQLKSIKSIIEKVYIKPELIDYISAVVHNTRNNGDLFLGASPRASLSILRASKAIAAMRGRGFVTPDDIKHVAIPVLNHRLILSHEREMEGTTMTEVINAILQNIEVPR
jgi:MoxR-like ATPase